MIARSDDRLADLLADRALHGLDPECRRELDERLGGAGTAVDAQALDRAAVLLDLALLPEALPAAPDHLVARLRRDAEAHRAARRGRRPGAVLARIGVWTAALAASLVVAFGVAERIGPPPATLHEQRLALLDTAPDAIQARFEEATAAGAVTGSIAWSTMRQQGFALLAGLEVNAPEGGRYRLWLHEGDRWIPCGDFDVRPGDCTMIVPMRPVDDVRRPDACGLSRVASGAATAPAEPLLARCALPVG